VNQQITPFRHGRTRDKALMTEIGRQGKKTTG